MDGERHRLCEGDGRPKLLGHIRPLTIASRRPLATS
jgi:hypothetical protein